MGLKTTTIDPLSSKKTINFRESNSYRVMNNISYDLNVSEIFHVTDQIKAVEDHHPQALQIITIK